MSKTFLEIGSGDFETLEYLADLGWNGIIIEPIPKYFNNLKFHPNVHYINSAIDWVSGTRKMYVASEKNVSELDYTRGMSSFFPRHEKLDEVIEVNTTTITEVLDRYNFETIDFLKIDTEGYDAEVVKMFPFQRYKPSYLKIEKEHLSHEDLTSTIELLVQNGYHSEWTERDIFGFLVR